MTETLYQRKTAELFCYTRTNWLVETIKTKQQGTQRQTIDVFFYTSMAAREKNNQGPKLGKYIDFQSNGEII